MKKKIFILFFLLCLVYTSCVFASDAVNTVSAPQEILSDLYSSEGNHVLNTPVTGNVFTTTKNFELSDTASVSGNIFVVANNVTLKSNVTYSDTTSKDGEYAIDTINSKSAVKGNAYIVCKEFTMEPGCEISGDLYIVANSVNIQKSASVGGNIFATTKNFSLNGRVQNSVYASSEFFSMNYYGSITNDLHLSAKKASLSSVIHRNVFIDANELETTSNFMLYGTLNVNSSTVSFSGEVDGNAKINAKELNFVSSKKDSSSKCLIKGNLEYSSENELSIDENIVKGETTYSAYKGSKNTRPSFSIKNFILDLITFVLYVFVIVWLFSILAKNYLNTNREITVKSSLVALGFGLLSIICVSIASILLLLINIGVTLAFVLLVGYALVLLLSIPLFVLDIAKLLNGKLNMYLATLLIALALFLVGKIPFIGGLMMFLFVTVGTGRIIKNLISK